MRPALEQLLRSRYPTILPVQGSGYGPEQGLHFVDCGDGWFDVIDALCQCLQSESSDEHIIASLPEAFRVKNKLGRLGFQAIGLTEIQRGMVILAEAMSSRICESCGITSSGSQHHCSCNYSRLSDKPDK